MSSVPSAASASGGTSDDDDLPFKLGDQIYTDDKLFTFGEKIYKKFQGRPKNGKTLKNRKKSSQLGPTNYHFYIEGPKGNGEKEGVNCFKGYEGLAKVCLAVLPVPPGPEILADDMVETLEPLLEEMVDHLVALVATEYDALNPTTSTGTSAGVTSSTSVPSAFASVSSSNNTAIASSSSSSGGSPRPTGRPTFFTVAPSQIGAGAIDLTGDDSPASASPAAPTTARGGKRPSPPNEDDEGSNVPTSSGEKSSKRSKRHEGSAKPPVRQSSRETKNKAPRSYYRETTVGNSEVEWTLDESQGRDQHNIIERISQAKKYGQDAYKGLRKYGFKHFDLTDDSDYVFVARGYTRTNGVEGITKYTKYECLGEAYNNDDTNYRKMIAMPQLALDALAAKGLVNDKGNASKECSREDLISICNDAKAKVDEIDNAELLGISTFCFLATKHKWRNTFDSQHRIIILAPGIELADGVEGVTMYSGYVALHEAQEADGDDGHKIAERWRSATKTTEVPTENSGAASSSLSGGSGEGGSSNDSTSQRPSRVSLSPSQASAASTLSVGSTASSPLRGIDNSNGPSACIDVGSLLSNQHFLNFVASMQEQAQKEHQAEVDRVKQKHQEEVARLKQAHYDETSALQAQLEDLRSELKQKGSKIRREVLREMLQEEEEEKKGSADAQADGQCDDPVFDGYTSGRTLRSEVTLPQINMKIENPVGGDLFCPLPNCKNKIAVSERGCNVTTCQNAAAHGGSFFYFCCHCKKECNDERADCDCSKRNNKNARLFEQARRNERAALSPIEIDGDSINRDSSVGDLKPPAKDSSM